MWDRIVSPGTTCGDSFVVNFREFVEGHALPHFTLVNMRPSAATQLDLETGGNLRKVQQFLQHVRLSTTVKYLLHSVTEPMHARVIQGSGPYAGAGHGRPGEACSGSPQAQPPAGRRRGTSLLAASTRAAALVAILTTLRNQGRRRTPVHVLSCVLPLSEWPLVS